MTFTSFDPYTGLTQKTFDYFTESQISEAIQKLHNSQKLFSKLSPVQRQMALAQVSQRMQERQFELAKLITAEMGKPIKESTLEVNKCINTLDRVSKVDLGILQSREVHSIYSKSIISHEALGVIYSIMPWNFPVWQVIRMVVPALLAGNTILLKHSEITPQVGHFIQELFSDVVHAPVLLNAYIDHQHTDFVLSHSQIGGVSLTGSVGAGRAVYASAAKYFKKAVLELGGSDPYIVLADADLTLAAEKIAKGRLNNCGQVCIAVKRVLVHESVKDRFLELLKFEFDRYVFGNPLDPKTDLGPLAHSRFKKALEIQLQQFKKQTDAELVFKKTHGQAVDSAFVDAEVYLVGKNQEWLKDQEFFAPILLVTSFKSLDEAVQLANATDFALGGGVFTQDLDSAEFVAKNLVAGQVAINSLISTDLDLPFGGFKNSGIGRELGVEGYFEFTQTKVISYS